MFPALPSLMAHFESTPNAHVLVPWMVTAPGLAIAILAPFAGFFVDRFGRLPLLIWATFFYGIFGTAPFFLDNLSLIFATRLMLGVCEAAILTVINTLIGDYWDDEGRRDWLFLQGIAGPFMGAAVIRLAGPVTELRWNGVFLIYGVAFVIFVLMKLYLFEPEKPKSAEKTAAIGDTTRSSAGDSKPFPLASMMLVSLVTLFASTIYYTYMVKGALVFHEVGITSPSRISELAALPALMVMVGAVVFRLLGKQPNGIQLGSFFLFLGGGLFIMGVAENVQQVVAGIVVQQVGIGMSIPAMIAWTQTKLTFAHRGLGMGIWTSSFFLGQFLSPWLTGRAELATNSVQGAFAVAGVAAMAAAAIGLIWGFARRSPRVAN
jgi:MFS family permease